MSLVSAVYIKASVTSLRHLGHATTPLYDCSDLLSLVEDEKSSDQEWVCKCQFFHKVATTFCINGAANID